MQADCAVETHADVMLDALRSLKVGEQVEALVILSPARCGLRLFLVERHSQGSTTVVGNGLWCRFIAINYTRLCRILESYGDEIVHVGYFGEMLSVNRTRVHAYTLPKPSLRRTQPTVGSEPEQLPLPGLDDPDRLSWVRPHRR